jgi:UDP-N-acetylmuramate--alanine ligase
VNTSSPVHFIGISGIGMSALARVLKGRGVAVQGSSDRATALTDRLSAEGIGIMIGHDAANLGDAGLVVVSSAIAPGNPELRAARERGLEIVRRGTLLARLMNGKKSIAVAGTHGKTTSSAMIAHVLEYAGFAPTWTVGGELVDYGVNAKNGSGDWFVSESDESDRSFLELRPYAAVITNIENDHVASDEEFASLRSDFERFASLVSPAGFLSIAADDPNTRALQIAATGARVITFGTGAQMYRLDAFGSRDFALWFDAWHYDTRLGRIDLPLVGKMNARNALGALSVALELGVPFARAAEAFASFHGVRRRFDVLARSPRVTVIDDYAHHPTAIAATIAAARDNAHGPLIVAFQPHRYTRTKYLANAFARALEGADRVLLTPVYAASELPLDGVDARSIGVPLAASGTPVEYVDAIEDLPQRMLDAAPAGSTALLMGAGSITTAASRLAELANERTPAGVRA